MHNKPAFVPEPAPHTKGDQTPGQAEAPVVVAPVAGAEPVGGAQEVQVEQEGDWLSKIWAAAALLLAFAILSHP